MGFNLAFKGLKRFYVDRIDLVEGRSSWRAPVNAVKDLRVP